MDNNTSNIPTLDLNALERELRLEAEYGDRPLEAFAGEAASAATLGASDVLLTEALDISPERLRETREREPGMAALGTVAGVVGPALVSGGTSLAAKAVSAPISATLKAGAAAERAVAAQLAKQGASKTAQAVGARAAGGAVEGTITGVGQLASDAALERRDLSAESALATVGAGALLGAGFGTALGTAQAAVPGIVKGSKSLKDKVAHVTKQGLNPFWDQVEGSIRRVTTGPAQRVKLRNSLGDTAEELPAYLVNDLELGNMTTLRDLAAKNNDVIEAAATEIDDAVSSLSAAITGAGTPVSRQTIYSRLIAKADEVAEKIAGAETSRNDLRLWGRYKKDLVNLRDSDQPFSLTELNLLRKQYQQKAYAAGAKKESFEADLADMLRGESRLIIDDLGVQFDNLAPGAGADLRKANKRAHIGLSIKKYLDEAAEKSSESFDLLKDGLTAFIVDMATGFGPASLLVKPALRAADTMARNAVVIGHLQSRTEQVAKAISKTVDNVFAGATKRPKLELASTQILVNSGFSINQEKPEKLPKNRQEAFANLQKNLEALNDENQLVDLLAKRTARIANASPEVAMVMQGTLAKGVAFLNEKMPRPAIQQGAFIRPWQPSTMELGKFERYLQVIESPMTVLQDLQQGTLTREHVEALQAVYPEIYREVRMGVLNRLNTPQGQALPYAKKVQIGILLNIPADSSLAPESVMMLQQGISGQIEAEQGQQRQPQATAARAEALNVAGREQTNVQRLQERK